MAMVGKPGLRLIYIENDKLTEVKYSPRESAMVRLVMTAPIGKPFPSGLPTVTMSGTTPYD